MDEDESGTRYRAGPPCSTGSKLFNTVFRLCIYARLHKNVLSVKHTKVIKLPLRVNTMRGVKERPLIPRACIAVRRRSEKHRERHEMSAV